MDDNTYTVVDYETLEPYFPEELGCNNEAFLTPPSELIERSDAEKEVLRKHPFFNLGANP